MTCVGESSASFIYLTYTLLLAITVSIEHLRGYQTLPLKIT